MKLLLGYLLLLLAISDCVLGRRQTRRANGNRRANGAQRTTKIRQAIVGGNIAPLNSAPYLVSLRRNGNHVCGGAIFKTNYIITAAQCVVTQRGSRSSVIPASQLSIRAGSVRLNQGGALRRVESVVVHPGYRNFINDIAVVKLSSDLLLGDSIAVIPLATADVAAADQVMVAGWGRPIRGGNISRQLRTVTLPAISNADCVADVPALTGSMFCVRDTLGKGICRGDNGGPAVVADALAGIANFAVGRCGNGRSDVFAKISTFADFINTNTAA